MWSSVLLVSLPRAYSQKVELAACKTLASERSAASRPCYWTHGSLFAAIGNVRSSTVAAVTFTAVSKSLRRQRPSTRIVATRRHGRDTPVDASTQR